ncbi:MAG: hypothetical protein GY756_02695 [bacterium]|nr:hypothetical protein [bacterium]
MLSSIDTNNDLIEYSKTTDFKNDYEQYKNEITKEYNKLSAKPLPSLFHPIILPDHIHSALKNQSEQMEKILDKILKLYLNETEIQDFFDFNETLRDWINIDPGYEPSIPFSRYDGFWDGETYRFCEFNTDGTSGMDEINIMDEIYLKTKIGQNLKNKYDIRSFKMRDATLQTLLKYYKMFGRTDTPNIAIVDFTESATGGEFESLKNYIIKSGYNCEICDIRKLKFNKGELWHNNYKIDLIYRRAVTDEMLKFKDQINDFIEAYKEHAVCVVGPICSQIIHSKKIFTFLSSKISEKYFTNEEILFIKDHLPYTKRLINEPVIIEELINDKDKFFIKPHNSYGCKGVISGPESSLKDWKRDINEILDSENDSYLIQKKIEIPKITLISNPEGDLETYKINLGPYVFAGELIGFYGRVSKHDIITTHNEGLILPLFYLPK